MKLVNLKGRECRFNPMRYRVDWARAVSGPQKQCKDFLFPYWQHDLVIEEARIPGSLLRIDLWDVTRSIVVEVSPKATHGKYTPFFHGSVSGHLASMKRDLAKVEFARLNSLVYIEIDEPDIQLNPEWFKKQGVIL